MPREADEPFFVKPGKSTASLAAIMGPRLSVDLKYGMSVALRHLYAGLEECLFGDDGTCIACGWHRGE